MILIDTDVDFRRWKLNNELSLSLSVLLLSTLACMSTSDISPVPPTGGDASIRIISKVIDDIQVNQTPVPGEEELFEEAGVGTFNGGEGLLNFGGALILCVFNNTEVGGVESETDPNSSLLVRLPLVFGGFSGQLN